MGTYTEFIDCVRDSASALERKARALNGKLRQAMNEHSRDPKLEPEGPLSMDGLKSLAAAVRDVRSKVLISRMNRLIQELINADKELAALDAQINQDILSMHSSIMGGTGIPDAEAGRLSGLFDKWQSASRRIECAHGSLVALAGNLERAMESADALESATFKEDASSLSLAPRQSTHAAASTPASETMLVQTSVPELLSMKNLLVGIMGLYLHRHMLRHNLAYCCSKLAGCKLASIQVPVPLKMHRKYEIKDAVRSMESRLLFLKRTGEEKYEHLSLFSSLVCSARMVYLQLPADVRNGEAMRTARFRTRLDSASMLNDLMMGKDEKAEDDLSELGMSEAMGLVTGFNRIFFLELFEPVLCSHGINFETESPDDIRGIASVRERVQLMVDIGGGLFYSRDEVESMLHKFMMDDYALLIPPMNFVHESDWVRPPPKCHDNDSGFSHLLRLLRLISDK